jgi:hypothetical protein
VIDMDDLAFGLRTAAVGIAIVFGLLAALWLLLELALRIERGASSEADGPRPPAGATGEARTAGDGRPPDAARIAAIALAVERHVDERRRQAAPAMRAYWPGSLLYASRWVAAGRTRQNRAWQRGGRP